MSTAQFISQHSGEKRSQQDRPARITPLTALLAILGILLSPAAPGAEWVFESPSTHGAERTWIGPDFWANRLQDWRLAEDKIICVNQTQRLRTVHLLTARPAGDAREMEMQVRLGLAPSQENTDGASAGFLFAVGPDVDYRGAALVQLTPGPGGGVFVGVGADGQPVIRDNREPRWPGGPYEPLGVDRAGWKVLSADSFEPESGLAQNAFDGDAETFWHSAWSETREPYPHEICLDFGAPVEVAAVRYLPRQWQDVGRIRHYALHLAPTPGDWGKPVLEDRFAPGGKAALLTLDQPLKARCLRFVAKSEFRNRPAAAIAEIEVLTPADLKRLREEAARKPAPRPPRDVVLHMKARLNEGSCTVEASVLDAESGEQPAAKKIVSVPLDSLAGGLALVSDCGVEGGKARFWFHDWKVGGDAIEKHPERILGPILSTQYTLSRRIMKMTAQMMPIGPDAPHEVALQMRENDQWKTIDRAEINTDSLTATFRVADWDDTRDVPCRILYEAGPHAFTRAATVRRDPVEKPEIVVAGFTGNHNTRWGIGGRTYTWTHDGLWFPHEDLVERVAAHDPDLLFFSGDQVYEGASPTFADRKHLRLDYLYKWYLWCWAFRDLASDRPCIAIPDDHDVYQGNLWGQGGRKAPSQNSGGYVHPAWFVRMVERTQTANLPDPWDPTPIKQNIGVYYTDMTYGRIGFAILEDRKFKTGPEGVVPESGGRSDHVPYPPPEGYDPKDSDIPGAKLLGDRQLKFLDAWTADWTGEDMKMALSQTVFANVATLHGAALNRLTADYDSNGWPQSGRSRALAALRKGFALMLCGDQHLATLVHHGVEDWNDAGWSLCVPSIANFYPRAWVPLEPGRNRRPGMPDYTGEFLDGLGNRVTVMAATNPGRHMGHEPEQLHDRMPGYGIVRCNKTSGVYTMECWPRYADPSDPSEQYEGWPLDVAMLENYGEFTLWLPVIEVEGLETPPVLQLIREDNGEIVYTHRLQAMRHRPGARDKGVYTVRVGLPASDQWRTLEGLEATEEKLDQTVRLAF